MKKIKIIELEQRGPPAIGGVERNVLETSKRFSSMGFKTEIWSSDLMDWSGNKDKKRSFIHESVKVRKFGSYNLHLPFLKIAYFSLLKKLLHVKNSKNTVLHTHSLLFHTLVSLLFAKRFRKVIVTLHLDTTSPPKGIIMKVLKLLASKKNVYITGDTENERKFFIKQGFDSKRVFKVPNGVSIKEFEKVTKKEIMCLKDEYRLNNTFNVLYVGRLMKVKGGDLLIKALPLIKSKKVKVIFVGPDFGAQKEWAKLANELGVEKQVIFTGALPQKKVTAFFNACDVLTYPNYGGDSFGITLVEAMACKKPVIGARTGGAGEVIEEGKCGFIFDLGKYRQLANKIEILLKNPSIRKKMGNYGYNLVKKKYTWDIVSKKYLNIMQK